MSDTSAQRSTGHTKPPSRSDFLRRGGIVLAGALAQLTATGCANETARNSHDDVDDLRKVDPALVKYRESERIETGFTVARAVGAGPDGRIVVGGDREVRRLGESGPIRGYSLEGEPQCVAVGADGVLAVGLIDRVVLLDAEGRTAVAWPTFGPRAILTSIAISGEDIWVADAGNRRVYGCGRDGTVRVTFGGKDAASGYPGLTAPSPHLDVAVAGAGTVFVTNPGHHRVEAFSRDGRFTGSWGAEGSDIDRFCGCCNPTDIAVLADGSIVTTEKGLPRTKIYSASGKFECVVAGAERFAEDAAGLDVADGADGRVLVLDPKTRTVRVYVRTA